VFQANANGTGLREIANLDSRRTGGPVDIASGRTRTFLYWSLSHKQQQEGVSTSTVLERVVKSPKSFICVEETIQKHRRRSGGQLVVQRDQRRVPGAGRRAAARSLPVRKPSERSGLGIDVVRGWAFDEQDGAAITKVEFYIDGQRLTDIPCCSERADVRDVFPQYPANNTRNSGWGLGRSIWGNLPEGSHTVQVKLESTSGVTVFSDVRTVQVVKPGGFAFIDSFDLSQAQASLPRRSSGPERSPGAR